MDDFSHQRRPTDGKRRMSKQNVQEYIINKKYANLDRGEIEAIHKQFAKCDTLRNGNIQFSELLNILQTYYFIDAKVKEKLFKELESKSIKKLDVEAVLILASMLKEYYQSQEENTTNELSSEFIDAFVALGGEADQSGYVSRQTIIDKITNEFELTIDVAQFLEVLELQSDQLDFQAFCQMFEKEDKGMSRGGSVLSLLSHRSRGNFNVGMKTQESFKSLKVRYRDFERFQAEQDQKEMERNQHNDHAANNNNQYAEQDEVLSQGSDQSPNKLY